MPTYVVQRGDTLSRIARKLGLRSYRELSGYRSGNPNRIYPGEVLAYGSSGRAGGRQAGRRVDADAEGQATSWAEPKGNPDTPGLIAQVYFPFDSAALDAQDRAELRKLHHYSMLLMGCRRIHFRCVAHTDHRGDLGYNHNLASRRARAVCEILDQMLGTSTYYSSSATSRGAEESQWPLPSQQQMASDRRVDVFSSRLPSRVIRLREIGVQGRPLPNVQYREIHTRIDAPNLSLGGDRPIDAVADIDRLWNSGTVSASIQSELADITPNIRWRLIDHATGGILVVAAVEVRTQGDVSRVELRYVQDFQGVFAAPEHAIGRWRSQPSLDAPRVDSPSRQIGSQPSLDSPPVANSPNVRLQYQFFWFTRSGR